RVEHEQYARCRHQSHNRRGGRETVAVAERGYRGRGQAGLQHTEDITEVLFTAVNTPSPAPRIATTGKRPANGRSAPTRPMIASPPAIAPIDSTPMAGEPERA